MIKKFLIIFCCLILCGCATNAKVDNMIYYPEASLKAPANTDLLNNIAVAQVTGGKNTSALWIPQVNNAGLKAALEKSLQKANLSSATPNQAKYSLTTSLDKLDVPVGNDVNMQVTAIIHYQLTNISTSKIIYDKIISSNFSPMFDLNLSNLSRQQMGVEGAVRTNIGQLIAELYILKK